MRRVIFVDDEPMVLEGLRRQLRSLHKEWELTFAESGVEALERMAESHFDVIVSDMRMPNMDGAELLTRCKEEHPDTARVILSGHMELERALKSVRVAHQFLTKPCAPETLRRVLARTVDLQSLLGDPALRASLSAVDSVPLQPKTYIRLTAALDDPEISLEAVADVVQTNPVLAAKLLQLVNSAFVGLPTSVTSLEAAVHAIGLNMLRNLVIYVEIAHALDEKKASPRFRPDEHQRHSMLVARIASRVVHVDSMREEAFTAGMLHDLGEMLMAVYLPEVYGDLVDVARETGRNRSEVETDRLGFSHAEVGAYMLGLWGLPQVITEAVAHHHRPDRVRDETVDVVTAVHVADALARELDPNADLYGGDSRLDADYLARIDASDRIDSWRDQAKRLLGEVEAHV